jgi:RNA polymerase sigma factor (sigma-70 family)
MSSILDSIESTLNDDPNEDLKSIPVQYRESVRDLIDSEASDGTTQNSGGPGSEYAFERKYPDLFKNQAARKELFDRYKKSGEAYRRASSEAINRNEEYGDEDVPGIPKALMQKARAQRFFEDRYAPDYAREKLIADPAVNELLAKHEAGDLGARKQLNQLVDEHMKGDEKETAAFERKMVERFPGWSNAVSRMGWRAWIGLSGQAGKIAGGAANLGTAIGNRAAGTNFEGNTLARETRDLEGDLGQVVAKTQDRTGMSEREKWWENVGTSSLQSLGGAALGGGIGAAAGMATGLSGAALGNAAMAGSASFGGIPTGQDAYYDAKDKGYSDAGAAAYGIGMAGLETGIELLGNKFIGPGLERILPGVSPHVAQKIIEQTRTQIIKQAGKETLKAMGEESLTEGITLLTQKALSKYSGVEPRAFDNIADDIAQTLVSTFLSVGAGVGPKAIVNRQDPKLHEQLTAMRKQLGNETFDLMMKEQGIVYVPKAGDVDPARKPLETFEQPQAPSTPEAQNLSEAVPPPPPAPNVSQPPPTSPNPAAPALPPVPPAGLAKAELLKEQEQVLNEMRTLNAKDNWDAVDGEESKTLHAKLGQIKGQLSNLAEPAAPQVPAQVPAPVVATPTPRPAAKPAASVNKFVLSIEDAADGFKQLPPAELQDLVTKLEEIQHAPSRGDLEQLGLMDRNSRANADERRQAVWDLHSKLKPPVPQVDKFADRPYVPPPAPAVVQQPVAKPEPLKALQAIPEIQEKFKQSAGVKENLTVGEHTTQVLEQYEKVHDPAEIDEIGRKNGITNLPEVMKAMLTVHDIGKGDAVKAGDKSKQHEFTVPLVRKYFKEAGFGEKETEIAAGMIGNDAIGEMLQGKLKVSEAAQKIRNTAYKLGLDPSDFLRLQSNYYKADASSYPALREKVFGPKLKLAQEKFGILEEMIHGEVREFNWVGRTGKAGGGYEERSRSGAGDRGHPGARFVHGTAIGFEQPDENKDTGKNRVGKGFYILDERDADVAVHYGKRALKKIEQLFQGPTWEKIQSFETPEQFEPYIAQASKKAEQFRQAGDTKSADAYDRGKGYLEAYRDKKVANHVLPVEYDPGKVFDMGSEDANGRVLNRKEALAIIEKIPGAAEIVGDPKPGLRAFALYDKLAEKLGKDAINKGIREAGYDTIHFMHRQGGFSRPYSAFVALDYSKPQIAKPAPAVAAPVPMSHASATTPAPVNKTESLRERVARLKAEREKAVPAPAPVATVPAAHSPKPPTSVDDSDKAVRAEGALPQGPTVAKRHGNSRVADEKASPAFTAELLSPKVQRAIEVTARSMEKKSNGTEQWEDIAQEANIKLLEHWDSYDSDKGKGMDTWAKEAVRNKFVDIVRKKTAATRGGDNPQLSTEAEDSTTGKTLGATISDRNAATAESQIVDEEAREHFHNELATKGPQFLSTLNAQERAIYDQSFGEKDKTDEAISKSLKITPEQVAAKRAEIIGRLRDMIDLGGFEAKDMLQHAISPYALGAAYPMMIAPGMGIANTGLPKFISPAYIKSAWRKWMTAQGNLTPELFDLKVKKDATIGSEMQELKFASTQLKDAVHEATKGGILTKSATDELNKALQGNAIAFNKLPRKVQEAVARMRSHIDALSARLIANGASQNDLSLTILDNLGTYVTRSYQIFDDPNWPSKVSKQVRQDAFDYLKQLPENQGKSDHEIKLIINRMLTAKSEDSPMSLLSGHTLGHKDLSIFQKRQDIPEPIRKLWGEYTDVYVNYERSITKMAHLAASHEFLTDALQAGLGKFFFEKDDPNAPLDARSQISAEGNKALAPLAGYYTFPELKEAMEEMYLRHDTGPLMRTYMKFVYATKVGKTVLSPITHARNFLGNLEFHLRNWNIDPRHFGDAFKATWEHLKPELPGVVRRTFTVSSSMAEAMVKRYKGLGILSGDVHAEELKKTLNEATSDLPDQLKGSAPHNAHMAAKQGLNTAMALYGAGDDVHKIYAFENERAKLEAAYKKSGKPLSNDELDRRAAATVLNTYPTYSRIGKAGQALRRLPFVSTFVAFPLENARTTYNSLALSLSELADPVTRKIGAQRLMGNALAFSAYGALAMMAKSILGVSDEEEDDIRLNLPDWQKNSTLLFLGRSEKGKAEFMDLSWLSPSQMFVKPIRAMLRGGVWEGVKEAGTPFISEDIFTRKVVDLLRNVDSEKNNRPIYNPEDTAGGQVGDGWSHLWKALEPGFISQYKRMEKAVTGEMTETGRVYNVGQEVAGLFGFRVQTVDAGQSLKYKANAYYQSKNSAAQLFTGTIKRNGTVMPEEIREDYQKMERARRARFNQMHEEAHAAIRLGVPREQAEAEIEASQPSKEEAARIMDGIYLPYTLSKMQVDQVKKLPNGNERLDIYRKEWEKAGGVERIRAEYDAAEDPGLRKLLYQKLKETVKHERELPDQTGS